MRRESRNEFARSNGNVELSCILLTYKVAGSTLINRVQIFNSYAEYTLLKLLQLPPQYPVVPCRKSKFGSCLCGVFLNVL